MGLTSDVLRRYKRETVNRARITLVFRKSGRRFESPRIDINRLSGELLRVTRPLMLSELRKMTSGMNAAHRKHTEQLRKLAKLNSATEAQALKLTLAGHSKRMNADREKMLLELEHRQDLILARADSRLRRVDEDKETPVSFSERPARVADIESILEKRLSDTSDEIKADTRNLARAEAEKAIRRYREENELIKMRGGSK